MSVHKGLNVTVRMDPAPLIYVKLFHPASGPDRHLQRKTSEVARLAVALAPKRTGWMASRIKASRNRDEKGRFTFGYSVTSPVRYSLYVHEGTKPHRYGKWPGAMQFWGTGRYMGKLVTTNDVKHPGNRAQPFLQDALIAMAL